MGEYVDVTLQKPMGIVLVRVAACLGMTARFLFLFLCVCAIYTLTN